MATRVTVQTDLTKEELQERYRQTKDVVERTHWHILWLIKEGKSPREVGELLGYSAGWVRTIVKRWNAEGEQGIRDHRHEIVGNQPLLSAEQQAELAEVLKNPPADGGLWSGPKVAQWMQERLGRPVDPRRGWDALLQHASSPSSARHPRSRTARGV